MSSTPALSEKSIKEIQRGRGPNGVRYLTQLSGIPQIYTNSTHLIPTDGPYKEEVKRWNKEGQLLAEGHLKITAQYKLRPYDEDALVAIFKVFEQKGVFDEMDHKAFEEMSEEEMDQQIQKCKKVRCTLDDILTVMNIPTVTNNRITLIESLEHQSSVRISLETRRTSDGDIHEAENYGLLDATSFQKSDTTETGYIELSSRLMGEFLRGNYFTMNLHEYFKWPKGRHRRFFRYLSGLFTAADRHEIKMNYLLHTVLGFSKEKSQARKVVHYFNDLAKTMEQARVLEPGFSLPKNIRTYDLISINQEGDQVVSLLKGPYYENKEVNELPTIATVERQNISSQLHVSGLSLPYVKLYICACNKAFTKPIKEGPNTRKNRPARELSVDTLEGGILINYDDPTCVSDKIELNWDSLKKYLDFVDLLCEFHEDKLKFMERGKGGLLRTIIEEGMFYSEHEENRLKLLKNQYLLAKSDQEQKEIKKAQEKALADEAKRREAEVAIKYKALANQLAIPKNEAESLRIKLNKLGETKSKTYFFKNLDLLKVENTLILVVPMSYTSDLIMRYFGHQLEECLGTPNYTIHNTQSFLNEVS